MSDRWERIGRLFGQALSSPANARDAIIDQSAEPEDIKAEVRSLVAAHESADEFMSRPASASASLSDDPPLATGWTLPALAEGTMVGQYRVLTVVGRGGMGVVYQAEDTRLHRKVALKSLSPELSREERQRQRLRLEARAAAALTHPGIATVYALEEFDDQIYIVSEYLDGRTLRIEIERGPAPALRALATGLEIARALCAAHERGIVHRDLKPENVVRTSAGGLKILDFGLAQFSETAHDLVSRTRLTQPGMIAGTPPYMSPEQLLGHETDFRSDHFSFGVVLNEVCTGRHPFGGRSIPSTIAQILAANPPAPLSSTEMSPEVWRVIERCLQKDPAMRFATTRELVDALESIERAMLASGPADVREPGVIRTTPPGPPDQGRALDWWRFHQIAAALAYWAIVWPAWIAHRSIGRAGLFFFFAVLASVVVAGNLRLHLWFSSRVYPQDLLARRSEVSPWIRAADVALAVLLVGGGMALPNEQAGWAAVLISFGIGAALAFLFIEPATARAAFRR